MSDQKPKSFKREVSRMVEINYLLYLPEGYEAGGTEHWPLILFLHGRGESGDDLEIVKQHGLPRMLEEQKLKDFPCIVVSPQCPEGQWWYADELNALLEDIVQNYAVDPDRIYLTGLSMGGFGTWELASRYPDWFAAIAPICGGGRPSWAHRIKHLPIWAFHGAKDEVVPLQRSVEMVEALKKLGANVLFTIYPDAYHDSWTETYANPKLYDWLLSHKKSEV